MAVNLHLDTKDLAEKYDASSQSQFNDGCVLLEKLDLKSGYSVLDIGCGTGSLAPKVIESIGNDGQYIGIDPLIERIAIANQKHMSANAVFKQGIADNLSFLADNTVDIVYMNWVFHWIADKKNVIQEINRVLKPNGKFGITIPCKELHSIIGLTGITDKVLKRDPYKSFVRQESSTQKQYNLTTAEWINLFIEETLIIKEFHVQVSSRVFQNATEITQFMTASFFGNYLNHVPDDLREQAITDIEAEFESYRTVEGLKFDYYPLYAVVQKQK